MKKVLLSAAAMMLTTFSFGQITIDSSNVMHANETINTVMASSAALSLSQAAATGANVTWDFTHLDSTGVSSDYYQTPSTGWGYNHFPNASFVENDSTDTSSEYYLKTGTELIDLGGTEFIEEGDTLSLHVTAIMLTFPSTYGTAFTNTFSDTSVIEGLNLRYIISGTQTSKIDGWGTAKMPKGDFPVIRQKTMDSIELRVQGEFGNNNWVDAEKDTEVDHSYYWWTNNSNIKSSLVEVDYDSATAAIDYIGYINKKPAMTGIQEFSASDIKVAPNPTDDYLNLILNKSGDYRVNITDMDGRKCMGTSFSGSSYRLDVSNLPAGIYLYNIENEKTDQIVQGKFVKQ